MAAASKVAENKRFTLGAEKLKQFSEVGTYTE